MRKARPVDRKAEEIQNRLSEAFESLDDDFQNEHQELAVSPDLLNETGHLVVPVCELEAVKAGDWHSGGNVEHRPAALAYMGTDQWSWRELNGPVLKELDQIHQEMTRLQQKREALLAQTWERARPVAWDRVKSLNDDKEARQRVIEKKIREELSAA